jgi:dipeptidyl aminopeptidase/acylaminoacyl peptidase
LSKKSGLILIVLCFINSLLYAQTKIDSTKLTELTIEKIMRDTKWMGTSPSRVFWSEDSKNIYFNWNPENAPDDSMYFVSREDTTPRKVTIEEQKLLPSRWGDYNHEKTKKVYEKNGDIFLLTIKTEKIQQITNTLERESNPAFSFDEQKIIFRKENNLFFWHIKHGTLIQLTDFRKGNKKDNKKKLKNEQDNWLQQEELKLIETVKERKEKREVQKEARRIFEPDRPKEIYFGSKRVRNIQLSPDEKFVTFVLSQSPKGTKRTIVPNYITESGYSEDLNTRTKVGAAQSKYEFNIYDIKKDTVYSVSVDSIPGIFDQPEYMKSYKSTTKVDSTKKKKKAAKKKSRKVYFQSPVWSEDGKHAILSFRAQDRKDRWIAHLDLTTGNLKMLYRQHDEAWIGGPGSYSSLGWLPDNKHIWFQSEEDGYAHLYTLNVKTANKKQLTKGKFEVYDPRISKNKKYWYFTANKVHPGIRHFYRMNLDGGRLIQITNKDGSNRTYLSPDEKTLAILHSFTNKPWELFLMENKPNAKMKQATKSVSDEFLSYHWRDPEVFAIKARDSVNVYTRLYKPTNPEKKAPAIIFVHGAGYLQNAHRGWSSYFREYMFHNLLADNGYYVLDIDYRGSAGYGRDCRTAIYRHMGGKDLSDQVDGAKFLVNNYDVDPNRIGIYGGSYGGFITLMAMFTEPDIFAAGAALRPVTDWAHYNHWYTSNILNVPYQDSLAYVRSSPIYHAEGLKGALLMCHGMVDRNVHFQGVVRLAQRLIELGKDNWEVAIYPMEGHGFREPSSWTDEYKRIFKLFEENLK